MNQLDIVYSGRAVKFLEKNKHLISFDDTDKLITSAIKKLMGEAHNIDLVKMKGKYKNHYRIRKGDIRIIFFLEFGYIRKVLVEDINQRGSIY